MNRRSKTGVGVAALLALGTVGACKETESLGANCLPPTQACAGKRCGDTCLACTAGSLASPDVTGYCGSDGVCAAAAPSCATTGPMDAGASPGCGKAGAATGVLTSQTIAVAGQTRTYVLSVPVGYDASTPLALVFAWHGANVKGSLARDKIFNLEADSRGAAIFVYPDGLTAGGWEQASRSVDFQLFAALVDTLLSSYCIDPNRIFSTGHGAGAVMTNDLGCQYGNVLRAIAPVEGTPPSTGEGAGCTGKTAALIIHGENDSTIPLSEGQATRDFWLAQNACATQTTAWVSEPACVGYQGCQPDLPVVWCVHDEGHAWPNLASGCDGGICYSAILLLPDGGSEMQIIDCNGGYCYDAGRVIWAFFSTFR